MRPHRVEVPLPRFDDDLRLGTRAKPFEAEALVAELAVEALTDPVLPWLARIDERRIDTLVDDPRQHRTRDEFGPVVAAQERRCASLADQQAEHLDDLTRERIRPSTSIARPSFVNSSAQASNTKSMAQT
jgi:hypothetical protein